MSETQLLFKPGEMPMKSRPNSRDDEIVAAAVEKILPDVIEWMGEDWCEDQREQIIDDLKDSCEREDDGYQIARALERKHWTCDSRLVEILDDFTIRAADARDKALREWVADSGIRPKLATGLSVTMRLLGKGIVTGVIIGIQTERGEYYVTVESLGQKFDPVTKLGSFYVVAWEWLEEEITRYAQPPAPAPARLDSDVEKEAL